MDSAPLDIFAKYGFAFDLRERERRAAPIPLSVLLAIREEVKKGQDWKLSATEPHSHHAPATYP